MDTNNITLGDLLETQHQYEQNGFLTFEGHNTKLGREAHAQQHIGKMMQKISPILTLLICEKENELDLEILKNEIVPDLLFYHLHLSLSNEQKSSNLRNFPYYQEAIEGLRITQMKQDEDSSFWQKELNQYKRLGLALCSLVNLSGIFASEMEKAGHARSYDLTTTVIPQLLSSSLRLSTLLGTDPAQAYFERLEINKQRINLQKTT